MVPAKPMAPLAPQPPIKNFQKQFANDKKLIRYKAVILSKNPNENREAILSYYLADDTISIYETPQR
jgi:hypothetical protein